MYKLVECKSCLIWNNLQFSNIYKDSKFCKYGKGYMPKESRLLCNKYKELKGLKMSIKNPNPVLSHDIPSTISCKEDYDRVIENFKNEACQFNLRVYDKSCLDVCANLITRYNKQYNNIIDDYYFDLENQSLNIEFMPYLEKYR